MRDAFPDPEELLLELQSRYKARIRAGGLSGSGRTLRRQLRSRYKARIRAARIG